MSSYEITYRIKGYLSQLNDIIQGLSMEAWAAIAAILLVAGFMMLKGNGIRGA